MRPDAFERIGAAIHPQADHLRIPIEHRVMQRPMLVVFGHIHVHEFGPGVQHCANNGEVARPHGLGELAVRDQDAVLEAQGPRALELVRGTRGAEDLRAERPAELDGGDANPAADGSTFGANR